MATSSAVQSILISSPVTTGAANNVRATLFAPRCFALPRNARMQVLCMAKDGEKESPLSPELNPSSSTPKSKSKVSTDFFDLFAFSGPAPERINGRLAMIGFVAAIAVEIANGQDVFAQISNGGIPWFVGTSAVLSLASLVPLFKGVRAESEAGGLMTPDAELWNGRFAMLGLVALAFTEYVKGGALV